MADRNSDNPELIVDELKRKARRRLVGAVVLALAAAIVLPLLLEKDPKPLGEDVSVNIPPIDDGRFVNKLSGKDADAVPSTAKAPPGSPTTAVETAPAKADAPVVAATEPKPAPTAGAAAAPKRSVAEAEQRMLAPSSKAAPASAPVAASTPAAAVTAAKAPAAAPSPPPAATPVAAAAPQSASKAEPGPAAAAPAAVGTPPTKSATTPAATAPSREGFVVQLAAFADDKGAKSLAGKLKKGGYAAYVEPVETSRGTLWRVRVGGYASRADADAGRAKLKAEGQNGILTAAK